ncbi:MAG: CHASE3 domain-containing protein [Sphingobium sp.]|uniref:CHASE3 domain-containing protein n=1 Tax=Sphingobium sp. TaxID=1912891 RepID=UPI0029A99E8F|nr:CHASE3 domain-containing protein [Sphingobium sp.]MDX3910475.1 CHASE3 domain-containing protein [Sphingobium sp.]
MLTVRNDRSIRALVAGFVLLALAIGGSIWFSVQQHKSVQAITQTLEVQSRLAGILSRLQDAETGQRGYLLTGRREFLGPYDLAIKNLPPEFAALEKLLANNPAQSDRLHRLREISAGRQAYLRLAIAKFEMGAPIDILELQRGKQTMDHARRLISDMRAHEQQLLRKREASSRVQRICIGLALALSGLTVMVLGMFAVRHARARLTEAVTAGSALARSNAQLREEAQSRSLVEAQLRQVQKMEAVGQLTGGIAHDFNNMLAVIVGSLDIARRRLGGTIDKRIVQNIENALEGAHRATQLTSHLLAFSRQQPLEPRAIDTNKLVGGMSELLRRTIGESLQIETVLAGGLWPSFVDPNQLENAILNLCVNARDAMPDGGKLTIETSNAHLDDAYAAAHQEVVAGQYVVIAVTDTGMGMSRELIERAFEPFFTTKEVGRGTGLGLSQVFGFIKQSKGHVKIYSEVSEGTTVKLYLPRHMGPHDVATGPSEISFADDLLAARDGEIVLVVEDEDRVRNVSVDGLRDLGYTVVQAADAAEALAVLANQPRVDLLFTDVVMPEMNGRKLVDHALIARPDLKVLYTTGYTRNAIVHNGMLDPGVALLSKPFTLTQLARKVRQVLDSDQAT